MFDFNKIGDLAKKAAGKIDVINKFDSEILGGTALGDTVNSVTSAVDSAKSKVDEVKSMGKDTLDSTGLGSIASTAGATLDTVSSKVGTIKKVNEEFLGGTKVGNVTKNITDKFDKANSKISNVRKLDQDKLVKNIAAELQNPAQEGSASGACCGETPTRTIMSAEEFVAFGAEFVVIKEYDEVKIGADLDEGEDLASVVELFIKGDIEELDNEGIAYRLVRPGSSPEAMDAPHTTLMVVRRDVSNASDAINVFLDEIVEEYEAAEGAITAAVKAKTKQAAEAAETAEAAEAAKAAAKASPVKHILAAIWRVISK